MSSGIQFYKSKIFSEEFTEFVSGETSQFSEDDIKGALKELFKGKEAVSSEYVNKLFENVELEGLLDLSDNDLKKIDSQFSKNLSYLFDPKQQPLSFVDKQLWQNLEKIIQSKISEEFANNHENKKDSSKLLDNISDMCQDYRNLKKLFQEKNLFISGF